MREDALQLYGFAEPAERELFTHLLSVSGIGPKVALGVLSGISARELAGAIARGDVKRLTQIPHVGKKIAERIVVELKDKIGNVVELPVAHAAASAAPAVSRPSGPQEEALSALVNLGYKRGEAEAALSQAPTGVTDVAELVRHALTAIVFPAVDCTDIELLRPKCSRGTYRLIRRRQNENS